MSTKPKLKLQFTEKMLQEYTVEKIKKQSKPFLVDLLCDALDDIERLKKYIRNRRKP
jgi:hypothetical protein